MVNKFQLSNFDGRTSSISGIRRLANIEKQKRFYSHLNLFNVTLNNSGYYSCSINTIIKDDLNQTLVVSANSTYFVQVQYIPIVRPLRRTIFANYYDQVEISCEIKSNPQSIFAWFYGAKELFSNYKYNLSTNVYKQINRVFLDDPRNFHWYKSTLLINSLTQFDYGDYFCKSNNIIGESVQTIRLKRKRNFFWSQSLKLN